MSKLEDLIQKYCPDGVEYVSIGSLISRVRNKGGDNPSVKTVYSVSNTLGLVKAEDYRDNVIYSEDTSNYIIVEQGMFAYNPSRLNIGSLAWLQTSTPGLVSPMYVVFSLDHTRIIPEYLYLHLKSKYVIGKIDSLKESGARFRFDFERWNLIDIPVPPIPIQEEIIEVLNPFTELQTEIRVELQKRIQQYNYYRDSLLSFKDRTDIKWRKLGELSKIGDGLHGTPQYSTDTGYFFINGNNLHKGIIVFDDNTKQISEEEYERIKVDLDDNTLLMSINGTVGNVAFYRGEQIALGKSAAYFKINSPFLSKEFLYYYLQSSYAHSYYNLSLTGSTIKNLGLKSLREMLIPVPSLKEQQKIVGILDRFDTLTTDQSQGLPAEIEKRKQQYEFYRDKLLTFKRKEA